MPRVELPKWDLVLTASICNVLEKLRLALEVITGERVLFHHIDFNTMHGRIKAADKEMDFRFHPFMTWDEEIHIDFSDNNKQYCAEFPEPGVACISKFWAPGLERKPTYRIFGRSATNRWEVPILPIL